MTLCQGVPLARPPMEGRDVCQGNIAPFAPWLAFPVHRRNFVRQSDIAFVDNQLEALAKIGRILLLLIRLEEC